MGYKIIYINLFCLVFEPGEGEDNEEYKKIHDDYKNLVTLSINKQKISTEKEKYSLEIRQ